MGFHIKDFARFPLLFRFGRFGRGFGVYVPVFSRLAVGCADHPAIATGKGSVTVCVSVVKGRKQDEMLARDRLAVFFAIRMDCSFTPRSRSRNI